MNNRRKHYQMAQCGCGASGKVVDIDRVIGSLLYDLTIKTVNGDVHYSEVRWDAHEEAYLSRHMSGRRHEQ